MTHQIGDAGGVYVCTLATPAGQMVEILIPVRDGIRRLTPGDAFKLAELLQRAGMRAAKGNGLRAGPNGDILEG